MAAVTTTLLPSSDLLAEAIRLENELRDLHRANAQIKRSPISQSTIEYTFERALKQRELLQAKGDTLTADEQEQATRVLAGIQTDLNKYRNKIRASNPVPKTAGSSRTANIGRILVVLLLIAAAAGLIYGATYLPNLVSLFDQTTPTATTAEPTAAASAAQPTSEPVPTGIPQASEGGQRAIILPPSTSLKEKAAAVKKENSDLRYNILHTFAGQEIKNTLVITQTDYDLSAGRLTVLFDQLNNADSLDSPVHVIVNDVDLGQIEASDVNAMVQKTFDVANLKVGENVVVLKSEKPQNDTVNYGLVLDLPAKPGTIASTKQVTGALPMTGAGDLAIYFLLGGTALILFGFAAMRLRKINS